LKRYLSTLPLTEAVRGFPIEKAAILFYNAPIGARKAIHSDESRQKPTHLSVIKWLFIKIFMTVWGTEQSFACKEHGGDMGILIAGHLDPI
jgi:hypothetical protein